MKYLTDYTEAKQTALFTKLGVFFAFSPKQFEEGKNPAVKKYIATGGGMCVPKEHYQELAETLPKIHAAAIAEDLADNGKEGVIKRELDNHEAYYTWEIDATLDALEGYPITKEEVQAVFNKESSRRLAEAV